MSRFRVKRKSEKISPNGRGQDGSTELSDREARLRAILETAVEGIITIDEAGLIESVNPSAEKIFGYKARELIGKTANLLMPLPHSERHDHYIASYLRTGRARIIGIGREVSGRRKDGTIFPMDLSVSEVKLANRRLFTGFIRDISERKQLERQVLEVSEREQRRIGHDLHDGLCQQLAGIELMSQALAQRLAETSSNAAAHADKIARNVREAIAQTRLLARGLSPVTSESGGLMAALGQLAVDAGNIFNVVCRFDCEAAVLVHDHSVATNFFRIAQEAVANAAVHGRAKRIVIKLESTSADLVLQISDDGRGFSSRAQMGIGLRLMQSRANLAGGTLSIEQVESGGVRIFCSVPKTVPSGKLAKANGLKGKKHR